MPYSALSNWEGFRSHSSWLCLRCWAVASCPPVRSSRHRTLSCRPPTSSKTPYTLSSTWCSTNTRSALSSTEQSARSTCTRWTGPTTARSVCCSYCCWAWYCDLNSLVLWARYIYRFIYSYQLNIFVTQRPHESAGIDIAAKGSLHRVRIGANRKDQPRTFAAKKRLSDCIHYWAGSPQTYSKNIRSLQ